MEDQRPLTDILAEMGITHRKSSEIEDKQDWFVGEMFLGSFDAAEGAAEIERIQDDIRNGCFGQQPLLSLIGIMIVQIRKGRVRNFRGTALTADGAQK